MKTSILMFLETYLPANLVPIALTLIYSAMLVAICLFYSLEVQDIHYVEG